MRFLSFIITVVGVVLASSAVVLAADVEGLPEEGTAQPGFADQCLDDLQAFDETLEKVGFGILPPGGYGVSAPTGYYVWGVRGTPRQKVGSLRDAAYFYALDGDEQSCQMLLASMREIFKRHQTLVGSEADDPSVKTMWRRAHLSRAKPIVEMNHMMRADVLIGSEIRNVGDERLGRIEDLVLNPEKRNVEYVLVSRGGFLGFGEKLAAIRWSDLRVTEDHELYVLDVPVKALDEAPTVERGNFETTADTDWQDSLSTYWDAVLQQ